MDGTDEVRGMALPLEEAADLDPLTDRIGEARCVLIGEASHGTHEFYAWRAALTRRLVEERGFSFVAVEGDWPDCWEVNRSVMLADGAPEDPQEVLDAYRRWPTWMWANLETAHFCRWLRDRNAGLPPGERAGFYGLDVYSLWESLRAIVLYLHEYHPDYLGNALEAYRCFEPYTEDPQAYARGTRLVPAGCQQEVVELLSRVRKTVSADSADPAERLNIWQNAEVSMAAERYYRAMVGGGAESWNVRDIHMADTLDRLLHFHGEGAKAVVWAHNTHIGDARATDMARDGIVNLGQLARERYGPDDVVLVGFATAYGEVVAAPRWGASMEVMSVPPPPPDTLEGLLCSPETDLDHRALFVFADQPDARWLTTRLGHRAIGVVYDPIRERRNYRPSTVGDRYDALCWIARTSALQPLHMERESRGELETLPTGV
ncbi:erythromycin esterase family protein [Streptosporangium sp. NBC_01756]|uniref:erythromycin esterase family protein n=1 Tax=Streptosporangium sp. NBC_01756 TaxID=2975950 RepID=UPI002DDB03E2|nr:erythromycin esterase family protein [Streptosporangium sp. NBC_01756]WSC87447.1 erythromycin esterase family protein [Streptosporangium sp. NBC_01756]